MNAKNIYVRYMASNTILKCLCLVHVFVNDFVVTLFKHMVHSGTLILRIILYKEALWVVIFGIMDLCLSLTALFSLIINTYVLIEILATRD